MLTRHPAVPGTVGVTGKTGKSSWSSQVTETRTNRGAVLESLESGAHNWKRAVSAAETRKGRRLWMPVSKSETKKDQSQGPSLMRDKPGVSKGIAQSDTRHCMSEESVASLSVEGSGVRGGTLLDTLVRGPWLPSKASDCCHRTQCWQLCQQQGRDVLRTRHRGVHFAGSPHHSHALLWVRGWRLRKQLWDCCNN